MEITILWKSRESQIRINSIADATIPSGVSPYWKSILSAKEPWFTPILKALFCSFNILTKGLNRSEVFFGAIQRIYFNERVSDIKNFATFRIIDKGERIGRNPKNKKIYKIKARKSLSFAIYKKFNDKIKDL